MSNDTGGLFVSVNLLGYDDVTEEFKLAVNAGALERIEKDISGGLGC